MNFLHVYKFVKLVFYKIFQHSISAIELRFN